MHAVRKKKRYLAAADQLAFCFDRDAAANDAFIAPAPLTSAISKIGANQKLAPSASPPRKPRTRQTPARLNQAALHSADIERPLTVDEAAEVLSVSVKTLEAWRRLGKGPMFVKLGRSVRYTKRALDEFTSARTVRNSAEGRMLDIGR
jgi:excisionase family DNA binding protein